MVNLISNEKTWKWKLNCAGISPKKGPLVRFANVFKTLFYFPLKVKSHCKLVITETKLEINWCLFYSITMIRLSQYQSESSHINRDCQSYMPMQRYTAYVWYTKAGQRYIIHCCIHFSRDRLLFYAEILIVFGLGNALTLTDSVTWLGQLLVMFETQPNISLEYEFFATCWCKLHLR